ncbi:MAG: Ig-like domain-containing protein, partial [Acidobacteriota bacterium]|nr:Ig-like domain-containing protein [Acidobacteriota bacterium]
MSKLIYCLTFACCMFVASARAEAASVTLAWDPNGEADLAGYIVLFGTQSRRYDRVLEVGKTTTWTFSEAEINKTYYFVVQAVNTSGARSEFSAEVAATVGDGGAVVPGPAPPTGTRVAINRTSFTIGAIAGTNGLRSASQKAAVTFSNGSSTWTATTDAPWLQISGGSGSGAGAFSVSLKSGSYAPSNESGTITVTAPNAPNSPLTIPVTLRVHGSGENPSGTIDTPVNNATDIQGAIAITGWATDDIGLKEVTIYRDPVIGEAAYLQKVQVFVGRAVFVDGARPDVDAALAEPFDYQAGWGYMLLTRMLPNQGNGTYKLHA